MASCASAGRFGAPQLEGVEVCTRDGSLEDWPQRARAVLSVGDLLIVRGALSAEIEALDPEQHAMSFYLYLLCHQVSS